MTTTADIAKEAFDAVAVDITDAVHDGTLSNGTDYDGRVVFASEKPPTGFPLSVAKDRVQEVVLEGFGTTPASGWTLVVGGVTYYVLSVRDIVMGGGLIVARVIAHADMLWQAVTIQRRTRSTDGAGGYTETWATFASVTGGIVALSGNERWGAQRVEAVSQWRLVMPYTSGLLATDRAVIGSVAHNIIFIDDHERRGLWHVLDLSQGVAT